MFFDRSVRHVRYSEVFGAVRLSSEKCRNYQESNMEDDNDKKGLLDGRQPYTPPYSPPNEYDEALFHEKGKSPKEVR